MKIFYASSQRPLQSGITLIELLVSMAIFSGGMLALLGLITNSMMMTRSANYTSVASAMAYALADDVRGNLVSLSLGSYDDPEVAAIVPGCLTTAGCTQSEIVGAQYKMWLDRLAEALPGGVGVVCKDDPTSTMDGTPDDWMCDGSTTPSSAYVIKICWRSTGGWICHRTTL